MQQTMPSGYGADADKIPEWVFETGGRRREFMVDGQRWIATSHLMLAATGEARAEGDDKDQVDLPHVAATVLATVDATIRTRPPVEAAPSRVYISEEGDGENVWSYLVDLGPVTVAARYVAIVDKLFGKVAWYAPRGIGAPAQALDEEGRVVAVVMPRKDEPRG